jgi:hypothetical protein
MNDEVSRPHTAVLNVQIEVHALTDDGKCSGKVLNAETLQKFGLKPSILLRVDGIDAEDCLKNLHQKLYDWNIKVYHEHV